MGARHSVLCVLLLAISCPGQEKAPPSRRTNLEALEAELRRLEGRPAPRAGPAAPA